MAYTVFISSTCMDLKKYRLKAIEMVNAHKCIPSAMEFNMACPSEPQKVCKNEIEKCDFFIGIYAYRYGFIPKNEEKSITQLEYEYAKRIKKECLCFIVDENYDWSPNFIDYENHSKLVNFLMHIKTENAVAFFTSEADFSAKLSISLKNIISKHNNSPWDNSIEISNISPIPLAPAPFVAHSYTLPENFTGRDAEMAMLSNWFHNDMEPVLIMEAIGGMGKSALSWMWMQKEILEKDVDVDGVFWWSFYEGPFDRFIHHLTCYVMRKGDIAENLSSYNFEPIQAILHNQKFLLVYDGLERELRGYSEMLAMYTQEKGFVGDKTIESDWDRWLRETIHPQSATFLNHLAASGGRTKVLITTRLTPVCLEDKIGVKHFLLKGLSESETVRFLRSEGIKGNRAELEQAGNVYDFHPLMLKLLASTAKLSNIGDISEAFQQNLIDQKDPQKILTTSFNLLSDEEKIVASHSSVFRSVFSFDSIKALFPEMDGNKLWKIMSELHLLGFLFHDKKVNRFDFHPIIRSFLYHQLTNRVEIHNQAIQYFQSIPQNEKIITFEDLYNVIELYHHLVKARKYEDAFEIFRDRIYNPAYYKLSAYYLIIELLKELFQKGTIKPPQLKSDQSWVLNSLANASCLYGQPGKVIDLFFQSIEITEKNFDKKNLAIDLGNVAKAAQFQIGQFSAAAIHLHKSITICSEINDKFWEAVGHRELGRILAFQDKVKTVKSDKILNGNEGDQLYFEDELRQSTEYWEKVGAPQGLSLDYSYRAIFAIIQSRLAAVQGNQKWGIYFSKEALESAIKAFSFSEKAADINEPFPRDFIQAYWLLGESLINCRLLTNPPQTKLFEISIFDDYFQEKIAYVTVNNRNELKAAETFLGEAIRRCRKVNLVEFESDILLALARLEWANWNSFDEGERSEKLSSMEKYLKESYEIAIRSDYRVKLADFHLFCSQVLLKLKKYRKLLGLNLLAHLNKAKEFAHDVSHYSNIYNSKNSEFYNNINEFRKLKDGMTNQDQIENGYYVAYKMAIAIEKSEQFQAAIRNA